MTGVSVGWVSYGGRVLFAASSRSAVKLYDVANFESAPVLTFDACRAGHFSHSGRQVRRSILWPSLESQPYTSLESRNPMAYAATLRAHAVGLRVASSISQRKNRLKSAFLRRVLPSPALQPRRTSHGVFGGRLVLTGWLGSACAPRSCWRRCPRPASCRCSTWARVCCCASWRTRRYHPLDFPPPPPIDLTRYPCSTPFVSTPTCSLPAPPTD